MNKTGSFKQSEWQSPALASIAELLQSSVFRHLSEQQQKISRAAHPTLDKARLHQELIQKIMSPSMLQAAKPYATTGLTAKPVMEAMATWHQTLAESSAATATQHFQQIIKHQKQFTKIRQPALKPSVDVMAMLRQPLVEVTASFAAHQRAFTQMTRLSRITALEETLQSIDHLFPAVHADIPQASVTLPAFAYMEENQPELCQQVDAALVHVAEKDECIDNLDAYIALCEQISVELTTLYNIADSSEFVKAIACLAVLFTDLVIYLKYCKSQKKEETS
ncbi:hypothetical protein SELR_11020 [Selenomonas ruminantium subsp. lactilytica TAM6421]|uniref:Uncharacterized protein n=1 Tax=Selenomonas ruminantium subsp. lactilytica (strain NBRC 103574 / TAM6421) TaxID=927704 RepID=I0GPX3_SELRL|nr:hypothetical protein [Selenomonas ruminantium]BAL82810.1 hypothetical protein SELR_11020 [Selenomonas ruminantium subsp. lactilytica TAM6421]